MDCTAPVKGHRPGSKRGRDCPACNPKSKSTSQYSGKSPLLLADPLGTVTQSAGHLTCLAFDLASQYFLRQQQELDRLEKEWQAVWDLLGAPGVVVGQNVAFYDNALLMKGSRTVLAENLARLARQSCPDRKSHTFVSKE